MPLPWVLPVAVGLFFLASRRGSGSGDETPPVRREGSREGDETPPVRREGTAPAASSARRGRRRREGSSPTVRAGDGSTGPAATALPIAAEHVTEGRVRAAERAVVALAADAQRTGTGAPSRSTILAAQHRTNLAETGELDGPTRAGLAELVNGSFTERAYPPRSQRHRAARGAARFFLLPTLAASNPAQAGFLRQHQRDLGVPPSGTPDQATALAAVTELARET